MVQRNMQPEALVERPVLSAILLQAAMVANTEAAATLGMQAAAMAVLVAVVLVKTHLSRAALAVLMVETVKLAQWLVIRIVLAERARSRLPAHSEKKPVRSMLAVALVAQAEALQVAALAVKVAAVELQLLERRILAAVVDIMRKAAPVLL